MTSGKGLPTMPSSRRLDEEALRYDKTHEIHLRSAACLIESKTGSSRK